MHAGTEKHRRLLRGPRDSGQRLGSKTHRSYRAPKEYQGQEHLKIRRHRRRRPLDGPRKTVRVGDYFRALAYIPALGRYQINRHIARFRRRR